MCVCVRACTGWTLTYEERRLVVSKQDTSRDIPEIRHSICILPDITWKAFVYGIDLATSHFRDSEPMHNSEFNWLPSTVVISVKATWQI